jgi:nucleoside-diphosphate-sugar epimerase
MNGQVVVTGGRGFIGSRLVKALEKMGNTVSIVEIDDGDGGILDFELLMRKFNGPKIVFHLGATSGNLYFNYPPLGIKTNCLGTWNVLEAARLSRVKRVIFASTQSLYAHAGLPHREYSRVDGDVNLYTSTKLYGEWLMQMFWRKYNLETIITRFASVYGIGEERKGKVANPVTQFIWGMMKGEAPTVYGDGEQTRDLTYVDDVVSALLHCMTDVPPGEIYNVSYGEETSFNNVIKTINKVLKTDINPIFVDPEASGLQTIYIGRQWSDNSKLKETGWKPQVNLEEGIKRVVEYTKERSLSPETMLDVGGDRQ